MAIIQTAGCAYGIATNQNGQRDTIVWWHNNTAPFYIKATFDEECNYVTFEAVKQAEKIGPTGEYANGIDRGTGLYGMAFYVAVGLDGKADDSLASVSQQTLWGRDNGISQAGSGEYHYEFSSDPRCVLTIPHIANRASFRYSNTVSIEDLGINDGQSKLYIYGACESASPYASGASCYDFLHVDGAFGTIMEVDVDYEYPPSNLKVTQAGSGTTLYPTIKWKQSSYSKHGSLDTLHYKLDNGSWRTVKGNGSGTQLLFTDLTPGTAHKLFYYITTEGSTSHYCSNESTEGLNLITYRIRPTYSKLIDSIGTTDDGYAISKYTTSAKFELQYQKDNDMVDKLISYRVYKDNLTTVSDHGIQRCNNEELCIEETSYSAEVTNLQPGTKYQLRVWLAATNDSSNGGANNGNSDTIIHIPFMTSDPFKLTDYTLKATGQTLTVSQSLEAGSSTFNNSSSKMTISLLYGEDNEIIASKNINIVGSGTYSTTFTGLIKGATYLIVTKVVDDTNISSTKTYYGTTYNVSLLPVDYSSSAVKFTLDFDTKGAGNISPILKYSIEGFNVNRQDINKTGTIIEKELTHGNTYTINAYVYDKNSSGEYERIDDTKENITYTLKTIIPNCIDSITTQNSISTIWQINDNRGNDYSVDNVTGEKISFVLNKCDCYGIKKIRSETDEYDYKTPDNDKLSGICTGDYQYNRTLTASGLDYWTMYLTTCVVTDGFNIVGTGNLDITDFPYSYIYSESDGKYHKAMPMVFNGERWILAPVLLYNNGSFKISNGDD